MNRLMPMFFCGAFAASLLAAPAVREGSVKLLQDDTRKIVVTYEITGEPAIVTAVFATNSVALNEVYTADVWGDVNKKAGIGTHTFYLDPTKIPAAGEISAANLSVTLSAWATNCPPNYLVADLCFTNVVKYYANTNSFPGGFGSDRYKTTEYVMRRIPAAGIEWRMGNPSWVDSSRGGGLASNTNHYVTISADYYMGVYEMTEAQFYNAKFGCHYGNTSKQPWHGSYDQARGTTYSWPTGGHQVSTYQDANNMYGYIAWFRGVTGLELDLPTEAQWEYACRAGSQLILSFEYEWNMSDAAPGQFHGDSWNVGSWSYPYAWFSGNSGSVRQDVGLLKPNKWGLYDMHGNMGEWCLDWFAYKTTASETDPTGPESGTKRVLRGGYYNDSCTPGMNGSRGSDTPSNSSGRYGYRLVCPIGE